MQRRQFLKSALVTGTGVMFFPSSVVRGAAPSNRLNIALIGCWGRGKAFYDNLDQENVVAICDVDTNHLAKAAERFPKAQQYADWRKCLDQSDIEAVIIAAPDHHHALIANRSMKQGYHVYCEKPLGITIEEVRTCRATYLANKHKLAVQMGTQRHAIPNCARIRELVRDGAIGKVQRAWAWGSRKLHRDGYLPAEGSPPAHLNWDLWLGPAREHPYNPGYFAGPHPGTNCLEWNMFWDFGAGQVGDMGAHNMDFVWNALDADLPTAVRAEGDPFNPDVTPVKLRTTFDLPANDWRDAVTVSWHQGGDMPAFPSGYKYIDINKIWDGMMFKGTKGFLLGTFSTRVLIPLGRDSNMTYYEPREADKVEPRIDNFVEQWTNACKTDLKTSCDFDYSGKMIEAMLLGLVAYRAKNEINYDGASGKITNQLAANQFLKREYRAGWKLDG